MWLSEEKYEHTIESASGKFWLIYSFLNFLKLKCGKKREGRKTLKGQCVMEWEESTSDVKRFFSVHWKVKIGFRWVKKDAKSIKFYTSNLIFSAMSLNHFLNPLNFPLTPLAPTFVKIKTNIYSFKMFLSKLL